MFSRKINKKPHPVVLDKVISNYAKTQFTISTIQNASKMHL